MNGRSLTANASGGAAAGKAEVGRAIPYHRSCEKIQRFAKRINRQSLIHFQLSSEAFDFRREQNWFDRAALSL